MAVDELFRIALITCDDVFGVGGAERSILRIANGLAGSRNVLVDILMLDPSEHLKFNPGGENGINKLQELDTGVTVFKLCGWTGGSHESHHWVDIHYSILELFKGRSYTLLHGFYPSITGFPTVYAAHELRIPSVVSIRGNDINRDVFHVKRFHHLKWALENATEVTAVSEEGLNRARIVGACPQKGRVILNSIQASDFTDGIEQLQLPRPLIGSLGVFKNKKGMEVLLAAFNTLLESYPIAHLLMIGQVVQEDNDYFHELLYKYNLSNKVTLTGLIARRDVLRYLRNLDIFVFPSLHEGCPNAVLEAMLAGLPIVATCTGSIPNLIVHEKHGLLVNPGSAVQLHQAIEQMLISRSREKYAQEAQLRALSDFTIESELDAYCKVYHDCLSSKYSVHA